MLTRPSIRPEQTLESRNNMLKSQALTRHYLWHMILDTTENRSIQPSELSAALGSSRTNATHYWVDELEKQGWIERH